MVLTFMPTSSHKPLTGATRNAYGVRMTKLDHITSGEACRILGVNPSTLARWAREEVVPSIKLPGRNGAFVYNRADIEIYAAARAADQENAS
jgi:transposase-like protein